MVREVIKQRLPASIQKLFQVFEEAAEIPLYRPSHMRFWLRDFAGQTSSQRPPRIVPFGLPTGDG